MTRSPAIPWLAIATLTAGGVLAGTLPRQTLAATLQAWSPGACRLVLVDPQGRPLADTLVVLEHAATGTRIERSSGAVGAVHAAGLAPGRWTVRPWCRDLDCAPGAFRVTSSSTATARLSVYPRALRSSTSTTSR